MVFKLLVFLFSFMAVALYYDTRCQLFKRAHLLFRHQNKWSDFQSAQHVERTLGAVSSFGAQRQKGLQWECLGPKYFWQSGYWKMWPHIYK